VNSTVRRHIDHLVIPVHDLAAAARRLAAAGYTVTPRADHPFGTSNRLVVFTSTYLELVTVTRPELVAPGGFAAAVAAFLAAGEGVSHAVVSTRDAAGDNATLAARGLSAGAVFDFSRPAPRADGTTAMASFSLAMALASPPLGAFLCQHRTPQAIWHRSHLDHPNGARSILAIELRASEPPLFSSFDVAGVEFEAAADMVACDGDGPAVPLGDLTLIALAGSRSPT